MFNPSNNRERRIFFPWEGRGALRRFFARGRIFNLLVVLLVCLTIYSMVKKERYDAGVRRSVGALSVVRPLVERYLVEHDGKCPANLRAVEAFAGQGPLPHDGWGRPLRLVCPTSLEAYPYALMSDGPDGLPGGLDRIED